MNNPITGEAQVKAPIDQIDTAVDAHAAAKKYKENGWEVAFPLPFGQKLPPPERLTGRAAATDTVALVEQAWSNWEADANLGLRMQGTVVIDGVEYEPISIDVDDYDEKHGGETIEELQGKLGNLRLRETIRSTCRGVDGISAQYMFLVPKGIKWLSNLKYQRSDGDLLGDVEIVQMTHRYTVAWPSQKNGQVYRWYRGDAEIDVPSPVQALILPERWIEHLRNGPDRTSGRPVPTLNFDQALGWLADNTFNDVDLYEHIDGKRVPLAASRNVASCFSSALHNPILFTGGAHDSLLQVLPRWVRDAVRAGAQNILEALERLSEMFVEEVTALGRSGRRSEAEADSEFERLMMWAVGDVQAEVEAGEYRALKSWLPQEIPEMFDPTLKAKWECLPADAEAPSGRLRLAWVPRTSDESKDASEGRPRAKKGLRLNPYSEMKLTRPNFLWEYDGAGAVPIGAMTIFTGKGGVGKSTACRWLVGQLTQGTLPGKFFGKPQGVLYLAKEEVAGAMVAPSLVANGADLSLVSQVELDGVTEDMRPEYMEELTERCREKEIRLVVVDPMSNYLNGANMNSSGEMRPVLAPWIKLAEDIGGSVLAIFHQNKSGGGDVTSGIGGAGAISEVSRSVFAFAKDDETGECVVSHSKHNLTPRPVPDLSYRLESRVIPVEDEDTGEKVTVEMGRFSIAGTSAVSAGEVQVRNRQVSHGEKQTAKSWLREHLRGLSAPALKSDVVAAGAAAGFSTRSVEDAAKKLGVKSTRHERKAMWSLD